MIDELQAIYKKAWNAAKIGQKDLHGIAAVARHVFTTMMADRDAATRDIGKAMEAYAPVEPAKPEAGDWAMEAVKVYMGAEFGPDDCDRRLAETIREAAELHYGKKIRDLQNELAQVDEQLKMRERQVGTAIKERDAAVAECERLRAELLKLGALKPVAPPSPAAAREVRVCMSKTCGHRVWNDESTGTDCEKCGGETTAYVGDAPPSPAPAATGEDDGLMAACEMVRNRIHNAGCWSVEFIGGEVKEHIRPLFDAVRAARDGARAANAGLRKCAEDAKHSAWELKQRAEAAESERDKLAAELREVRDAVEWSGGPDVVTNYSCVLDEWQCQSHRRKKKLDAILSAYRATKGKEQGDGR